MGSNPVISCIDPIGAGPMDTPDPFLMCVYHKDEYPEGDGQLQAPRRGNGADFNPAAPYRMYHGKKVPGFPSHPHRGFETITATLDGVIDHADSHGNAGRYGHGDLQWMTAGKGVQHSEMFPLVNTDAPNPTRFFQIWLNLPAKSKMAEPAFVMHWSHEVPKLRSEDGLTTAVVWAGDLFEARGVAALLPPPDSWAAAAENDVAVVFVSIKPGGTFEIPAAKLGARSNRKLYYLEGAAFEVGGDAVRSKSILTLRGELPASLRNPHATETVDVLLLQGKPIAEPIAQHGPFVMNTRKEIEQAFDDFQRTQFGGWPWDSSGQTFGTKDRFALFNGKETKPPPPAAKE